MTQLNPAIDIDIELNLLFGINALICTTRTLHHHIIIIIIVIIKKIIIIIMIIFLFYSDGHKWNKN